MIRRILWSVESGQWRVVRDADVGCVESSMTHRARLPRLRSRCVGADLHAPAWLFPTFLVITVREPVVQTGEAPASGGCRSALLASACWRTEARPTGRGMRVGIALTGTDPLAIQPRSPRRHQCDGTRLPGFAPLYAEAGIDCATETAGQPFAHTRAGPEHFIIPCRRRSPPMRRWPQCDACGRSWRS